MSDKKEAKKRTDVLALIGMAKAKAREAGMWEAFGHLDKAEERAGWEVAEWIRSQTCKL